VGGWTRPLHRTLSGRQLSHDGEEEFTQTL